MDAHEQAKLLDALHNAAHELALRICVKRLPDVLRCSLQLRRVEFREVTKLLGGAELHVHASQRRIGRKNAANHDASDGKGPLDICHAPVAEVLQKTPRINAICQAHENTLWTASLHHRQANRADARRLDKVLRRFAFEHVLIANPKRSCAARTAQARP